MVFQFTPLHLTLGGIERSNQDHWVLIWLCIIDNYTSLVQHRQLDSGAVRPRGLLLDLRLEAGYTVTNKKIGKHLIITTDFITNIHRYSIKI